MTISGGRGARRRDPAAISAERAEPGVDVDEVGVAGRDAGEQLPGAGQVSRPLVEIGKRIGHAEVVQAGLAGGTVRRRRQQLDGLVEPALIGQGARGHDPPLGHELGPGTGGAQLVPQLLDLGVPSERPVAVREDGVLFGAARQRAVGLELLRRLRPAAQAVEAQPVQLTDGGGAGCLIGDGAQDAPRLLEPLPPERLVGLPHAGLEARQAVRRDGPTEVVVARRRLCGLATASGTGLAPASATAGGAVGRGSAPGCGRATRPALGTAGGPPRRRRVATARSTGRSPRTPLAAALHGPGGLVAQLALVDPLLGRPGRVATGAAVAAVSAPGAVLAPGPRCRPPGVRRGGRRDLGGAAAGEPTPSPRPHDRVATAAGGRPPPARRVTLASPGALLRRRGLRPPGTRFAAALTTPAAAAGGAAPRAGAGARAAGTGARPAGARGTAVAATAPALRSLAGCVPRAAPAARVPWAWRAARAGRVARAGRRATPPAIGRAAAGRPRVPIPSRARWSTLLACSSWTAAPRVRRRPSRTAGSRRPPARAARGGRARTTPASPPVVGPGAAAAGAGRCHVDPGYWRPHEHRWEAKREEGRPGGRPSSREIRRRPTLPGSLLPSTIGAGGLNFRVRYGNGCDPSAMATEICCQLRSAPLAPAP